MRTMLHLLTRPDDELAAQVIRRQREAGERVVVVDLTGAGPDYPAALEEVFAADSVQVW